jgi:hypothetical protein
MSERVQGSTASLVTAVPMQAPRGQGLGARGPVANGQGLGMPALTPELAPSLAPEAGTQQAGTQQAAARQAGARQEAAEPTPMTARQLAVRPVAPRPVAPGSGSSVPGPCRATVRDELEAVLTGAPLSTRDRQFLSKLVHWDKRNAASVASLLRRARRAGRDEAALTPVQLETVLAALEDAVVHRVAGLGTVGCWDCEKVRGGRCAEHSRDFERARDYADLAALLAAGATVPAALAGEAGELHPARRVPTPIQRPTDISGYRRRAPIVS